MHADLAAALRSPQELIASIHASSSASTSPDEAVCAAFDKLFKDAPALAAVPILQAGETLPPHGTLVRFRAMVQDTSLGPEVYLPRSKGGKSLSFGLGELDESASTEAVQEQDIYEGLQERANVFLVNVPGEAAWARLQSEGELNVAELSLNEKEKAQVPAAFEARFPNQAAFPKLGLIAKIYNADMVDSLRSCDVRDFVGLVGATTYADALSAGSGTVEDEVPALHVLFTRPVEVKQSAAIAEADLASVREELVATLASAVDGDAPSAEWVLLALLARIHTRTAGLALGALSLNLAFPNGTTSTPLAGLLNELVPRTEELKITVDWLNDSTTKILPRARDEVLESGRLQLVDGTTVVCDFLGMGEGLLQSTGVANLTAISNTIQIKKLAYQFPFSTFELDTDLSFIVISEGKSLVNTDCVQYVSSSTPSKSVKLSPSRLSSFRSYLQQVRQAECTITPAISEYIQADFVKRRKAAPAGVEPIGQEDLLFQMTVARLLATSKGLKELDEATWEEAAALDEARKARFPVQPKKEASSSSS